MTFFVDGENKNPFAYPDNAVRQPYQWLVAFYNNGGEVSKGFVHGSFMGISLLANGVFMKMEQAYSATEHSGFACKVTGIMEIVATALTVYFAYRMLNNLKALYNPDNANRVSLLKTKLGLLQQERAAISLMIQNVLNGTLDLPSQDRLNLNLSLDRLRKEEKTLLDG